MEKITRIILDFRSDEVITTRLQRIARMLLNFSGKISVVWFWTHKKTVDGSDVTNDEIERAEKMIIVIRP